jgi:hypothetical protein
LRGPQGKRRSGLLALKVDAAELRVRRLRGAQAAQKLRRAPPEVPGILRRRPAEIAVRNQEKLKGMGVGSRT